jgi:restriction system protein
VIVNLETQNISMSVPDYQSLMLPLLRYAKTCNREIAASEAVEALALELNLTEEDLREMLPSGTQSKFINRLGWAATYMKKAGLLKSTRRGYFIITERGIELLNSQPEVINVRLLEKYPEFLEFRKPPGARAGNGEETTTEKSNTTPLEALEDAYENLRHELADELQNLPALA